MEVVCDNKLRIWHVSFGVPDSSNDKTIMDNSTSFNDFRNGKRSSSRPSILIAGREVRKILLSSRLEISQVLVLCTASSQPNDGAGEKIESAS